MIRGVDAAKGHMKRLYTRCVNREASLKFDEKWGGRKNNATKQSIPHERTNKQTNTRTHAHTSANSHLHAHKKKHNTPAANIAPLNVWNQTAATAHRHWALHAPTRIQCDPHYSRKCRKSSSWTSSATTVEIVKQNKKENQKNKENQTKKTKKTENKESKENKENRKQRKQKTKENKNKIF